MAAAMCNFVFAGAWTIASVSRWGYIGKLSRKVLLVCLADDSLAVMLNGLLRGAGLVLSLEESLKRAIAENPEDLGKEKPVENH